ncbi:helix-turn-helix domain-containing protein [Kribbella aluminosa]
MDNSAVRRTQSRDDGTPIVDRLLPGHLDVGPGYSTVRPRGTEDWLLIHTIGGAGRFASKDSRHAPLTPHSVVTFAPNTPQDYATHAETGTWDLLWVHLRPRPEWLTLLDWPTVAPGIRRLDLTPVISQRVATALEAAVGHHRAGLQHATAFAINAVEEALLWCSRQNPRQGASDPQVMAVVEYVSARLPEPHTVASLARIAGLSPSHFAHTFRRHTGMPVMSFVQRLRIDAARELLELTDLTVAQVATRVGYDDPLYFSRRFRSDTGTSPTQFRSR